MAWAPGPPQYHPLVPPISEITLPLLTYCLTSPEGKFPSNLCDLSNLSNKCKTTNLYLPDFRLMLGHYASSSNFRAYSRLSVIQVSSGCGGRDGGPPIKNSRGGPGCLLGSLCTASLIGQLRNHLTSPTDSRPSSVDELPFLSHRFPEINYL